MQGIGGKTMEGDGEPIMTETADRVCREDSQKTPQKKKTTQPT